jgi:hypothetical protein
MNNGTPCLAALKTFAWRISQERTFIMIADEMGRILGKLTQIANGLVAIIDARKHEGITTTDVMSHLEKRSIFEFLASFREMTGWRTFGLTDEDKLHLLGEWQSMANAIDAEKKLGVANNGICLLLAYVVEGIQMRTHVKSLWPCPDPV